MTSDASGDSEGPLEASPSTPPPAMLIEPTPVKPIQEGAADASKADASAQPRPKRALWKKLLIASAVLTPVAIGGLWVAVHTFPWAGPLVANSLRATIGKENVTRLEEFAYSVEDKVNRKFKKDAKPRTYWKVPPAKAAALPTPSKEDAAEDAAPEKEVLAPFAPKDVGPAHKAWGAEGDGVWVPMVDPRRPEEAARTFKTLLHPDESRSWSELFVVAVDLRTVEVMPVMGYQEPRSDKKEAEGYVRPAKIPEAHWGALLGAFNGGFMAEHGHYGVVFDGITFIDPKDEACTMARFDDGHVEVLPWPKMKDRQAEMTWLRQAPNCMYAEGQMHPALKVHQARKWGATLDGNTVIRRSAVGLSQDGQVLYVGISNHTNAKVMALGMHHAGAHNVAQMDVNWSYPKFVTYELDKDQRLVPVALAEGFEFNEHLYLRHRSMRDFFYLARKEEVTVPKKAAPTPALDDASKSTDAKPADTKSNDARSADTKSADAKSNDAKSNDAKSNDAKSNDAKPAEAK